METSYSRELFDYGIHNEASNIRAHVGVLSRTLFVFPTVSAVGVMRSFKSVSGFQPGIESPTSRGYVVPPSKIPNLRMLQIAEERLSGFCEHLSTSEKGNRAVAIVMAFLKSGRFPLWVEGELVNELAVQITGTDIVVKGNWKIEVKCDYRASAERGRPHERCSGFLFLQSAERNPLGKT